MKKGQPLVSAIITTFNRSDYLKCTLESIANQTYSILEIIVVDDGSIAKTAIKNKEICESFKKCQYFYKENTGQPDSRNYGIKRSNGKYIAFCDDDDFWVLDKIEKQVNILNANPKFGLVLGNIEYVKSNGEKTGIIKSHKGYNHGNIFQSLLVKNRTKSIIPLVRKEVFEKVGYFNPHFVIAEDWEFWRRASYFFKFYFIDEILAYVRLHPDNMSKQRTADPLESFLLYRKLTKSLIKWGKPYFKKQDYILIYNTEWNTYRKLMTNHCQGNLKKLKLIFHITMSSPRNGFHLMYLFIKFNSVL